MYKIIESVSLVTLYLSQVLKNSQHFPSISCTFHQSHYPQYTKFPALSISFLHVPSVTLSPVHKIPRISISFLYVPSVTLSPVHKIPSTFLQFPVRSISHFIPSTQNSQHLPSVPCTLNQSLYPQYTKFPAPSISFLYAPSVTLSQIHKIPSTFHQFPVSLVHRNVYITLYCVPSL
jgi:hypothetical protein